MSHNFNVNGDFFIHFPQKNLIMSFFLASPPPKHVPLRLQIMIYKLYHLCSTNTLHLLSN